MEWLLEGQLLGVSYLACSLACHLIFLCRLVVPSSQAVAQVKGSKAHGGQALHDQPLHLPSMPSAAQISLDFTLPPRERGRPWAHVTLAPKIILEYEGEPGTLACGQTC